jgi:hypothetical protein
VSIWINGIKIFGGGGGGGGGDQQWFTLTFGRDAPSVLGGTWLRTVDGMATSATAQIVPIASRIKIVTAGSQSAKDYSIEVLVNGSVVHTLNSGGAKNKVDSGLSINVAAGDEISARVAAATVAAPDRPLLTIIVERA